jgi:tetratricopeptide (TPR) repeat protein
MKRFRQVYISLCAAACLFAAPAVADQNDKRLDVLFERLLATTDAAEAASLQQSIWDIWVEFSDPQTKAFLDSGILAMNAGHLSLALTAFSQVIKEAPEFAEGWNKRATVLFLLHRFDDSVEDIARTLTLEPRHFGALSGLGQINMAMGRREAAARAFEQALKANPHLPGLKALIKALREKEKGEET